MIGTLLVFWYACGWAATAMWCRRFGDLSLVDLLVNFMFAPVAVCLEPLFQLFENKKLNPTIWRKP
ncbi:MAG TPA: hypothetical protein VFE62_09620 [Gemmataceae bacterium]|nr:hypothetical protein [Gemmataceae bacterium]